MGVGSATIGGRKKLRRKTLISASFVMRSLLVAIFFFFVGIFLQFRWILGYDGLAEHQQEQAPRNPYLSPQAYPVYGIKIGADSEHASAVYAIPKNYHESQLKGTVLLLHACTHNALKFFAPSSLCTDCVGLAEEMRLARIVLERGYAVVAVTASSKGGCWGGDKDVKAIRSALENFAKHYKNSHALELNFIDSTIYALGASSGGAMAAKLVAEGLVESAAVMVMSLRNPLLDKILAMPEPKKLYLAPMIRDQGTTKRVRENEAYWKAKQQQQQQQHELIVDEISCVPLAVTADYLWNRVPGMTQEAASIIVNTLLEHKHLDPNTLKLIVDPTKSKWRDFFLNKIQKPASLRLSHDNNNNNNNNNNNIHNDPNNNNNDAMMLWDTFDLTPGMSPLAKALHRAWAMHEYCSEIVELALDFFEGQKTRTEILGILQMKQQEQESIKTK